MNLGQSVTRHARQQPDAVAWFGDPHDVTWAELDEDTDRLAAALGGLGVENGDRVVLMAPNSLAVVEVLVACAKAGAVYVGLNFRLDGRELSGVLENARPTVVLVHPDFEEAVSGVAADLGIPVVRTVGDDESDLAARCAQAPPGPVGGRHDVGPEDDACIVYSSGTTGVPKGILFSHAAVLQHALVAIVEYGITVDSRYLVQLPHNSSVNITLAPCLVRGAALGMEDSRGFDPVRFADRVQRDSVTHTFLVPTMLYRLLEKVEDPAPLASLEVFGYGSSAIPRDRVERLVDRFGPRFVQLYGMAEIASIGTLLRAEDHARGLGSRPDLLSSAGRSSLGVTVRVVDPAGADVPPGERGEVVFGGPHVMRGYYRDPERTAAALIDGWMHSGDVGVLDGEGYLFIVDRLKDLVIRGGHNIAPREIEEVLFAHDAVLEAAVVGVPDEEWGEAVAAAVVVRDGSSVEPDELREWCRSRGLASIKVPGRVQVLDEIPKNQVGKFDKKALAGRLGAGA